MSDDIGKYQNQIPSLSALDIESYERIFKVYYDSINGKKFPYYNILKKIEIPELDSSVIEFYDVQIRQPLTTVSFNVYGDIRSWWIIYLINKDKFTGVPFWVEGGTQLKVLKTELRTLLYLDITQNTIFGGRHF
jgi:hypothetical protein